MRHVAERAGVSLKTVSRVINSEPGVAVEAAARARGYMVITGSCEEDPERERELVLALLRRRVDALLLVPAARVRDHAWLARELGGRTPVVFLDRPPYGLAADT